VQWRTPITLAVLLAILMGAAYYGWQTIVDPGTDATGPTPSPTTTTKTTKQVCLEKHTYPRGATFKATSFKVNVYNAGGISGQAGDVLTALRGKGFQEGVAANPPARVTATNVSIVTLTPNSPRVRLVAEQFKGKVLLVPGPEMAVGVDVIIGTNFVGIDPTAPAELTIQHPVTVCSKFKQS